MQNFAYFQEQDSEQFTFYKIPKVLFTDPEFSGISTEAKLLYGVLLDRVGLSRKNGWIDENGNVFIQFTVAEMMEYFHWSRYRIYEILNELGTGENGIGLVERKRAGLNKPNVIYVKNFASILTRNRGAPDIRYSDVRISEQSDIWISDIQTSGCTADRHPDVRYADISNTDKSKTDFNKTDIVQTAESDIRKADTENTEHPGTPEELPAYGRFHNVFLDEQELTELKNRFPCEWREWIERLSSYMKSTGKSYHNHYATICRWAEKERRPSAVKNYDLPEGKGL